MAEDTSKTFFIQKDILISVVIIIATGIVYSQTANFEFVNLDDSLQLTANSHVQAGFSWENIKWSFTPESPCSPLTWFMYTFLYSIFGLNPGPYHTVSVLFHITSSLLLFFTLKIMTGQLWKSAFVGALFAVHPINVESVAWIAELNNVLSAFFWVLTIMVYSIYARRPGVLRYFLVLLVFELGLLAKPVLMTLPFVLLLLDYWPLKRFQFGKGNDRNNEEHPSRIEYKKASIFRLVIEKMPFLILSAVSILLSLLAVKRHATFTSFEAAPTTLRVANALVSYTKYLGKLFWPQDLALLYPYPHMIPWWHIAGACVLLLTITILALKSLHKYPYFIVGWLWFIGTLVPFLGIIQSGMWPEMADRYAYVTFIGVFMIIAWGIPDLFKDWIYRDKILPFAGVGVLIVLMAVTWKQLGYWENSITLFEHVLGVNKTCYTTHVNLGNAFADRGEKEKAIAHYLEVLRFDPEHPDAHFNLAVIYDEQGKTDEAIDHYSKCLQADRNKADVLINLGILFESKGEMQKAVDQYLEAIRIDPGSVEAYNNLGNIMLKHGNINEAIGYYEAALENNPGYDEIHSNLGTAFVHKGKLNDAIVQFTKAIEINPDNSEANNNLQKARQIKKTIENSIVKLKESLKNDPENPSLHCRLGEIYTKMGDSENAIAQYRNALSIDPGFLQALHGMVIVYSNNKEYEKALGMLEKMRQIDPENADIFYNSACMYSKLNRVKESLYWLKQAVLKGFNNWDLIGSDPDLSNIRDMNDFKKLLQERGGE